MKRLLVLAGTGEARRLLAHLADDDGFSVVASLAGATPRPLPLGVETRVGGFGGVAGLRRWIAEQGIDMVVDMTHPYASRMHANAAAVSSEVPVVAFNRPAWTRCAGDQWREFDSWQAMADALPSGASVFLAGGSRAVCHFLHRDDAVFVARGLNFDKGFNKYDNFKFIKSLPEKSVEKETSLFKTYLTSHLCMKNAGGPWARAKLDAARALGLRIWILQRPELPSGGRCYQVCQTVEDILTALGAKRV